jgi:hypothetical protein
VSADSVDFVGRTPEELAKERGNTHVSGFFCTPLAQNLAKRNAIERLNFK